MTSIALTAQPSGWITTNTVPGLGTTNYVKCNGYLFGLVFPPNAMNPPPNADMNTYLGRWKFEGYNPVEYQRVQLATGNCSVPVAAANQIFIALMLDQGNEIVRYDPTTLEITLKAQFGVPNNQYQLYSLTDSILCVTLQTPQVQVYDLDKLTVLYSFELTNQKPFFAEYLSTSDTIFCLDQFGIAATYKKGTGEQLGKVFCGVTAGQFSPFSIFLGKNTVFNGFWDNHTMTTIFKVLHLSPLKVAEESNVLPNTPYALGFGKGASGILMGGNNVYSLGKFPKFPSASCLIQQDPKANDPYTVIPLDRTHFLSGNSKEIRTWEYTAPEGAAEELKQVQDSTWKALQTIPIASLNIQSPGQFLTFAGNDKTIFAFDSMASTLHTLNFNAADNSLTPGPTAQIDVQIGTLFFCGGVLYLGSQSSPSYTIDPVTLATTPLQVSTISPISASRYASYASNGSEQTSVTIYDGKTSQQVVSFDMDQYPSLIQIGDYYINIPPLMSPFAPVVIYCYDSQGKQVATEQTGFYGVVNGPAAMQLSGDALLLAFTDEVTGETTIQEWSAYPLKKIKDDYVIRDFYCTIMKKSSASVFMAGAGGVRFMGDYPNGYQVISATNKDDAATSIYSTVAFGNVLLTVDSTNITLWNNNTDTVLKKDGASCTLI